MNKLHLLGAVCACITTSNILLVSNVEAKFILLDYNNSSNSHTFIYDVGFDVNTQNLTSSAVLDYSILGQLDGVGEYNGTFYSLGLYDELFSQSGSVGTSYHIGTMTLGDFEGVDIYNNTRYLLGLNGEVFSNSISNMYSIGTHLGNVHSGFVDITFDGTSWYGLTEGGHIYKTVINNTGLGVDLGYVGATTTGTGWDGLAYVPDPVILPPPEVPVPAAAWLFDSGLLGLAGISRRKKTA